MGDEYTPLALKLVNEDDSCGPVEALQEIQSGDTISKNTVPWTGITAGAGITVVYDGDKEGVSIAHEGVDGDITAVVAGIALTGGGGTGSVTLNFDHTTTGGPYQPSGSETSGTASGIIVPTASGVGVCGVGDPASNGDVLTLDTANEMAKWVAPAVTTNLEGKLIFQNFNGDSENLQVDFTAAGGLFRARAIHVSNDLSGHAALNTTLDSSASISGCPYPPPFSWIQSTANLGTGVDNFYFGSGVSVAVTTMGSDGITFDTTNGYWVIDSAGWYEVNADIHINVTSSPATIKNYVLTTAGYGGVESIKAFTTQELRTNIDPHLTRANWMGYLAAGVKLAVKCDTDAGTIKSERYSTASVKRIG